MAKLSALSASEYTKILYIGDSSSGKTGSLTSLVADGYKLRVLDLDNGLESLKMFVLRECPDKIDNIDYEPRRDKYKASRGGPILAGPPRAFQESMELMTKWSDGSDPSQWGSDTIFVVDSLSALSRVAFEWAKVTNPTVKDPRQWYNTAQRAIEDVVALLTDEAFHANVIVISHVRISEQPDGTIKGHANAVGAALGPILPRYFNTLILAESTGSGKNVKRKIKTLPTGVIDLKNPAPFQLEGELPLETGLSTVFKTLKGKL